MTKQWHEPLSRQCFGCVYVFVRARVCVFKLLSEIFHGGVNIDKIYVNKIVSGRRRTHSLTQFNVCLPVCLYAVYRERLVR